MAEAPRSLSMLPHDGRAHAAVQGPTEECHLATVACDNLRGTAVVVENAPKSLLRHDGASPSYIPSPVEFIGSPLPRFFERRNCVQQGPFASAGVTPSCAKTRPF